MATDHRAELARIQRFDQLVRYLRDEMGWPIESDDFEELTFDYTAEELGINAENAAKIQEIKRLRPLSAKQPWGIFFVKFEPKHLPVVALRRVLSQVAIKKRASANAVDRAGWEADDLLFVSNYGQGGERQISFAHFARPSSRQDLPTLKVLGWDNRDTPLHLDAVAKELTEHLAWPRDEDNVDEWRRRWRSAFTLGHREVITTAERLSIRLAELAGAIRDRIRSAIAVESPRGRLTQLMKAFKESLVHDLDAEGFADMYAQTISYGLLSSRIADPTKKTADDFAAHMRTSPFLRELMQTFLKVGGRRGKADGAGIDFDELGVADVMELLDGANMEAVLRDFGDRNRQEDPVIHFFEGFLQAYDKKIRKDRGVFYTPQPVVSYIVRSVHELLQSEFGLEDGLADTTTWGEMLNKHPGLKLPPLTDSSQETRTISPNEPFVQILDPATGTATFLVEVIDVIYRTLTAKWKGQRLNDTQQREAWNSYVPRHLLPRLHAYELMMAPYAIAHMKIGLKLAETGYRFGTEERARVYLTNALEPWVKQLPLIGLEALAHEAAAVNEIKRHKRFTVVIGNPPYSNFGMLNKNSFILGLLEDYKRGLDEKKINLDDDFIKFIRFSQHLLENTSAGVIGVITNNVFIDGITHRQMRQALMRSFDYIKITDLHGSAQKREKTPDGRNDENVFDIKQGVAVSVFSKTCSQAKRPILCADIYGERTEKYAQLGRAESSHEIVAASISPSSPQFFFKPTKDSYLAEYELGWSIPAIMPFYNSGIQTKKDSLTIHHSEADLREVLRNLRSRDVNWLRLNYSLGEDGRDWGVEWAKEDVMKSKGAAFRLQYRPFDFRWSYFTGNSKGFIAYPRKELTECLLSGNVALATMRQIAGVPDQCEVIATSVPMTDRSMYSTLGTPYVFPLYVVEGESSLWQNRTQSGHRSVNLSDRFLSSLATALGITRPKAGNVPAGMSPEDIFHYAYAVFHSPGYRSRYAEFLKIDFPRLPLTGSLELFQALSRLGAELTALHLLASPKLAQPITDFIGSQNHAVEKISWSRGTVWIDKAQTTGFRGVREPVWNFHIGGYQVCEKWLKDRKGRTLSKDDIAHYQKVVVALSETIRLMDEVDEVINRHGGWPGAFAAAESLTPAGDLVEQQASPRNVVEFPARPANVVRTGEKPVQMLLAAEADWPTFDLPAEAQAPAAPVPAELDLEEMVCKVRQVLASGGQQAADEVSAALTQEYFSGADGGAAAAKIDEVLRAAVRRGVIERQGDSLKLLARSIDEYDRSFLKDQFLAALGGKRWTERDDAIRNLARWLGYRRTGPTIEETGRSLVNGLLREGRLESRGTQIRKA